MRFHPHQLSPQYQALPKNNSVGFFANIISFGLWLLVFGAWGYFAANFLNTPILTTLPASIGVVLLFFTGFAYWPFMFLGQAILLSTQSHAWAINFVLLFATYIDFLFITYALNQLYREPNLNQIAAQTLYRLLLPCIFSFLFFICVTWSVNAATQKQTYHFSVWTFFSILLLIGVLERVLVFSILYRFLYERSRLKGRSLTFLFATFSFIYGFFLKNILGYSPVWVYTLFLLIPVGIIPFVSTLANSTWASLALVLGITTAMCIHPVNTKAALESNINLIALLLLMALLQNGFAIIRTTFNALRHQENKINQKVRQVLNIAPVLVCSYNQQGHFFFWNEECERILGWSLQEVQTKNTPHQLFPAKPSQKDDTFPNSEKDKTFQIRKIKNKHGTIKSILWGSFQVAPDRYFGIGIHVTPKTQAALKLEKTRQHYQQILKNLPIGIFTLRLSPKGQYIFDYVNPFFSDTLGLSTKQIQHNPEIVLSLWKKAKETQKHWPRQKELLNLVVAFALKNIF